jgi:hypothetical protein
VIAVGADLAAIPESRRMLSASQAQVTDARVGLRCAVGEAFFGGHAALLSRADYRGGVTGPVIRHIFAANREPRTANREPRTANREPRYNSYFGE